MNTTASVAEIFPSTTIVTTIESKNLNPIEMTIEVSNDNKTVDYLLKACSEVIDSRYKPWFAKKFYGFEKNSVLKALSISLQDGKNAQKMFSHLVKTAK